MPNYAKFLKEILNKKRKIAEEGIVNLTATCSTIIQQNLPAKMKDLGSFTIPCSIRKYEFKNALCDSGASINLMPLSVVQRLSLGELTPTTITLQMAGHPHFCFLHGYSGYNQISIAPKDQRKPPLHAHLVLFLLEECHLVCVMLLVHSKDA